MKTLYFRLVMFLFLVLLLVLAFGPAFAQNKFTLSGTVTDVNTGEALIGTHIYVPSLRTGTTANNYGFFSITLHQAEKLTFEVSYLSYTGQIIEIDLDQNIELEIKLGSTTYSPTTLTRSFAANLNSGPSVTVLPRTKILGQVL